MVIAIDGPAGAGKSTVARAVARELGFTYLDTGAMYRAVGLAARGDRRAGGGRSPHGSSIEVGDRVLIDGRDVTDAIRTPEVSQAASRVAADPEVRAALVAKQQALMADGDWVAEGRDIALVVAPDAAVKVFLTADAGRARPAPRRAARRRPRQVRREQDARDAARRHRRPHGPRARAGRRSRSTPPGRRSTQVVGQIVTLAVEARECDESRRRRLPQRREVLARQPPHPVARGGRPRAPGHHARPQGAHDRVERPPADADRHRRRRPRGRGPARDLDPGPGARGDRRRPGRAARGRRARRRAPR